MINKCTGSLILFTLDPFFAFLKQKKTGFSHLLLTPFHHILAEAIRPHHPDRPEGNTMDTKNSGLKQGRP